MHEPTPDDTLNDPARPRVLSYPAHSMLDLVKKGLTKTRCLIFVVGRGSKHFVFGGFKEDTLVTAIFAWFL